MWGQAWDSYHILLYMRIIPTRVGTRSCYRSSDSWTWDHPHACGDKGLTSDQYVLLRGSSPRVWGQVVNVEFDPKKKRIIPTRVGTREKELKPYKKVQDHPHACGDKQSLSQRTSQAQGSSPRVWGQVSSGETWRVPCGIIPTRVGTRTFSKRASLLYKDHPHACGDKR